MISQAKHDSLPVSSELEHVQYCPSDHTGLLGLLAILVDDLAVAVLRVLSRVPPVQALAEGDYGLRVKVPFGALREDRRQAILAKTLDLLFQGG